MNANVFAGSTVSKSSFKLSTRKNLERIMRKFVQTKRKCCTEKGSWQGIHRVQSSSRADIKRCKIRLITEWSLDFLAPDIVFMHRRRKV